MAQDSDKVLCRCACGKMLRERAERHHPHLMVARAQAQAHQSNARRLMKSVRSKATKTISSVLKAVRTAVSSLGVSVRGGQAQSTTASEATAELQSEHSHGDLDMASIMDLDYANELPRASTAVPSAALAERDTLASF